MLQLEFEGEDSSPVKETGDYLARMVIIHCCLYYHYNDEILPDTEYEKLVHQVIERWDELDPIRQWQLGSKEDIHASGFRVIQTQLSASGALSYFKEIEKRMPNDPTMKWYKASCGMSVSRELSKEEDDWLTKYTNRDV